NHFDLVALVSQIGVEQLAVLMVVVGNQDLRRRFQLVAWHKPTNGLRPEPRLYGLAVVFGIQCENSPGPTKTLPSPGEHQSAQVRSQKFDVFGRVDVIPYGQEGEPGSGCADAFESLLEHAMGSPVDSGEQIARRAALADQIIATVGRRPQHTVGRLE